MQPHNHDGLLSLCSASVCDRLAPPSTTSALSIHIQPPLTRVRAGHPTLAPQPASTKHRQKWMGGVRRPPTSKQRALSSSPIRIPRIPPHVPEQITLAHGRQPHHLRRRLWYVQPHPGSRGKRPGTHGTARRHATPKSPYEYGLLPWGIEDISHQTRHLSTPTTRTRMRPSAGLDNSGCRGRLPNHTPTRDTTLAQGGRHRPRHPSPLPMDRHPRPAAPRCCAPRQARVPQIHPRERTRRSAHTQPTGRTPPPK